MTQFLTVVVGLAGVALGWLTAGYQRVTEKVIEERRAAYGALLEAAEGARSGTEKTAKTLEVAAVRAELVCSDHMEEAGLIRSLVAAVGRPDFLVVRTSFLTAARTDSSTPRMFVRGLSRKQYRSGSPEAG
jgi:hypothetical protein